MRSERSRALKARVASLRRVHTSAVSHSVARVRTSLANPSHVCTPQPRVVRAAIVPCTRASMHPCMRACVRENDDADIKDADNRRAFRARVGRPVILWVARASRGPPEDDRLTAPTPDARARTHINVTHAHTAPRTATAPSHARLTHKTRDASHRDAIDAAYPFSPFSAPPRPHRRRPATTHSTQSHAFHSRSVARVASTIAARARASRARPRRRARRRRAPAVAHRTSHSRRAATRAKDDSASTSRAERRKNTQRQSRAQHTRARAPTRADAPRTRARIPPARPRARTRKMPPHPCAVASRVQTPRTRATACA